MRAHSAPHNTNGKLHVPAHVPYEKQARVSKLTSAQVLFLSTAGRRRPDWLRCQTSPCRRLKLAQITRLKPPRRAEPHDPAVVTRGNHKLNADSAWE